MDVPWLPPREGGGEADASPPWVKQSRLQTQQELCAKRFLRFASLHQVHGAFFIWAAALFFAGVHPILAATPVTYFTGLIAFTHRRLTTCGLEHLSAFILLLNLLNAVHLVVLCMLQGERILASPLFACVPLSRLLFGLFTQEVHCHLGLSTLLAVVAITCNNQRVAGGEALLVVVALLLLELTIVTGLAEGPCGYEEAVMHLAQCRAQHQLARSQAVQRIDVEREEFSGRLLAVATQGIAELTYSVQLASEPVLDMLKSSCATGTKSAHEAERIGRIGETLKEEVAQMLRHKTQVTWARLQEHSQERTAQLRLYAEGQKAASESLHGYLQQKLGRSLAQMQELELEAEASLEQLIQGEVKRARETADARMDLVRTSAQAMERRISDTVEVLLSLLKYFRSKGSSNVVVVSRDTHGQSRTARKARPEAVATPLLAIGEGSLLTEPSSSETGDGRPGMASKSSDESLERSASSTDSANIEVETRATTISTYSSSEEDPASLAVAASSRSLLGSIENSSENTSDAEATSDTGSTSACSGPQSDPHNVAADGQSVDSGTQGLPAAPKTAARASMERHPLFASRLCYRSDNFFWSWASSRDFRAEADALRQWQRAAAASTAGPGVKQTTAPVSAGMFSAASSNLSSPLAASSLRSTLGASGSRSLAQIGPSAVYIDLGAIELPAAALRKASVAGGGHVVKLVSSAGSSASSESSRRATSSGNIASSRILQDLDSESRQCKRSTGSDSGDSSARGSRHWDDASDVDDDPIAL